MTGGSCTIDDCTTGVLAREMCARHYTRWRKHGDPRYLMPRNGNHHTGPPVESKVCTGCGYDGPVAHFRPSTSTCKQCDREYKAEYKKRPEVRARRLARAKAERETDKWFRGDVRRRGKAVGLDPDEAERIYAATGGVCEICGQNDKDAKKRLSFDHCHASGKFRGMLCSSCNTALGSFKDDIERLEKAIKYLRERGA